MRNQHDGHKAPLFDQFEGDEFDPDTEPETNEFWDAMPTGRLTRLRETRFQARSQRRTTAAAPSVPTATEVMQRVQQATSHVDPLLKRAGTLMVAIALLVPVAMAFRSGDDAPTVAPAAAQVPVSSDASATTIKWYEPLPTKAPTQATTPSRTKSANTSATTKKATPSQPVTATTTAAKTQVAAAAITECTKKYSVVAGDSWILIARKVSVTLDQMLAANNATARTMLWPRQQICLPANASTPTTAKPTPTTVRATPTTARPVTTVPRTSYSRDQVLQIIREIWPDNLEARAIEIATRESNLNPYSQNSCCSGLFQLYFNVHRTWLASIGITSATQLLDPRVNARAALLMYQRSGWAPWE